MDQVIRLVPKSLALVFLFAGALGAQDSILVVRPSGATFEEARKGIAETLGEGWVLGDLVASKEMSAKDLVDRWRATSPKAIVLMDNRSVALYREARAIVGDTTTPVVALMGVRLDLVVKSLSNAVEVGYEIPAVTSMTNLRSVLASPVRKIGVVYRSSWGDFFRKQAGFCLSEDFQLVGRAIPDDADPSSSLRKALDELLEDEAVDALWILNDNLFLTPRIIRSVWMPMTRRFKTISVVGVESLVNPVLDFGSFAVLPDHYALGAQVAGILQEIRDDSWKLDAPRAEEPLSVVKIINVRQLKKRSSVRMERLGEIDKVLE